MSEVIIIEKNGRRRSAKLKLTGKETVEELLLLLGLPNDYLVEANGSILSPTQNVPAQGSIIIRPAGEQLRQQDVREDTITLTIKLHNRTGVTAISHTFPSTATPFDIAETLVRSVGGTNPEDIHIISDGTRNLMESQYRYRSLADLGLRSGQILTVHGDIIQGE
ncbi:MAG: hypothetical protein QXO15_06325 [Nitrososphaerota archaeon]